MESGQVTAVIKEHEGTSILRRICHRHCKLNCPIFIVDIEVRDVIFHPYMPLIFSCSDGKRVKKQKAKMKFIRA